MVSSAHASLYGSRLIRLLRGLADDAPDPTLQNFAISFGRLADLSGSMTLLNAHEAIDDLDHGPTESSGSSAKAEFMKVRAALIRSVVMSFVPPQGLTPVRMVKLPTAEKLHSHYQATGVYGAARPWLPKKCTRPRLTHMRAFMSPANGTLLSRSDACALCSESC